MRLDKQLMLSDAQAETTQAAHVSTNVINLGAAGDSDKELFLVIRVDTSCTSGGAATVAFSLVTSAAEALSDPVTLFSTAALGYATLVAGYEIKARIPRGMLQYLGAYITIAGADLTAGKFDIFLTEAIDTNK